MNLDEVDVLLVEAVAIYVDVDIVALSSCGIDITVLGLLLTLVVLLVDEV